MAIPSAVFSWLREFAETFYRWSRRPRLRIDFDPHATYDEVPIREENNALGCFCHVVVRNDGADRAHGCKVELIDVSVATRKGLTRAAGFPVEQPLKWANEPDYSPRHIDGRGGQRRADLCYAVQEQPWLHFFFPTGRERVEPRDVGVQRTYPPGLYRVRVRVTAENAKAVEAGFDIYFDGSWDRLMVLSL